MTEPPPAAAAQIAPSRALLPAWAEPGTVLVTEPGYLLGTTLSRGSLRPLMQGGQRGEAHAAASRRESQ